MQLTSNVPFYYRSRDLNVGANGFAWHLSNGNANYGQESGHNVFHQPCTVDQYFGYHREMMRQIIQNHEATFRDQVQELHRLYRRQNELMNEIKLGEIFTPHLHSQTSESNYFLPRTNCEISRTKPHAKSWILGDCSDSKLSVLTSESNQQPSAFIATYFQETVISSRKDVNDGANTSMEVLRNQHAVNSELESFKTGDSSSFNNISGRKGDFLIDLNEPIQLEELASISTCPFETHKLHNAKGKFVTPNSSVAIDLNSVPETETDNEFLKMSNFIDLNTSVVIDEPFLPLSSTIVGTKFVGKVELEGPVSPENKEGSAPRGKSEEILEPFIVELDKTAAESLIMIYSSEVEKQFKYVQAELAGNFVNCLCWFAEIASSTGDDLENEITKFKSYPTDNDEGENSCIVARDKEPKGRSRNTRHHKSGLLKIKGGKKCGAKRKKCLMMLSSSSSSDVVDNNKKCKSKQGVLQSWGMKKKRRGGHRRPTGKFLAAVQMMGK